MDITQLRYFQAVAAHESLTAAARALGVSQPTLTVAIRKLEAHYQTILLQRNPRGVSLTTTGQALLHHSEAVFDMLDQACETISGLEGEEAGSFTIGCNESLGAYFLPGFLRQFMKEAPSIEVQLLNDSSADVRAKVISRDVHFALVVNPLSHPDLVITPLFRDSVDLFVAQTQLPIAQENDDKPSPSPIQDGDLLQATATDNDTPTQDPRIGIPYAQEDWAQHLPKSIVARLKQGPIIYAEPVSQCRQVIAQLNRAGLLPGRLLTCGDLELVKSLTLGEVGIGILPRRVAAYGQPGKLVRLHKSLPIIPDVISLVCRADLHKTRAALLLKEALVKYGRSL